MAQLVHCHILMCFKRRQFWTSAHKISRSISAQKKKKVREDSQTTSIYGNDHVGNVKADSAGQISWNLLWSFKSLIDRKLFWQKWRGEISLPVTAVLIYFISSSGSPERSQVPSYSQKTWTIVYQQIPGRSRSPCLYLDNLVVISLGRATMIFVNLSTVWQRPYLP